MSRFGNDTQHRVASAKLFATLLMTMRGTPYIYQGDEIGMTNIEHPHIDDYDDIETRNAWVAAKNAGKNMAQFLKAVHRVVTMPDPPCNGMQPPMLVFQTQNLG